MTYLTRSRPTRHHVLIACGKAKLPRAAPAAELYQGTLFRLSLRYARSLSPDSVYILSALHGLLEAEQVVEPYDVTLNGMPQADRRAWSERVLGQLRAVADLQEDRFTVLAGSRYREHILPHLANAEVPMQGMRIGEQQQYLSKAGPA